ncbi:MAG: DNRLRE domain-containing protein [Rariglobus sp.]
MTPNRFPSAISRHQPPKPSLAQRFVQTTLALGFAALTSISPASAATWETVPLGGGGYVTGIVSNSNASAIYLRTDVGGAFRWVPAADGDNGSWRSLSDYQVPFGTAGAESVMNVESIATDPNNLNRVYTASGDALWVSEDKGETWDVIPNSPVVNTEGNAEFRWCGERLAVDPNDSNILWFGSRGNGLQKGVRQTNGSWVWTVVPATALPWGEVVVQNPPRAKGGVMFVTPDKNTNATILYAGVHDTVGSTGGVYRSTDGGTTWTKLSVSTGATLYARRAQVASDGTLYVTAGSGGVYKVARTGTVLDKLTALPAKEYTGVAIDPQNSQVVYVADAPAAGTGVWRTTNGGANWVLQSSFGVRQEPDGMYSVTGYWFGATAALMVNPTNSNELWATDYFGASRTRTAQNIGGSPASVWNTLQKGQEETVVLALKNAPTGAKLVAGIADVGGFRYSDVTLRPYGAGGNRFNDPAGGNFTSIDFSEGNPNVWATTWVRPEGPNYGGTGSFSLDGGVTWQTFGKIEQRTVAAGTANTWIEWDVAPYLKQHLGGPITLILRNVTDTNGGLTFDSREGANPPRLLINGSTTVLASADAVVRDGTYGTTNDGTGLTLFTKTLSGATSYTRWSYLKFDLTGVSSVTSGKLRLYLTTSDTVPIPVAVYANDVTSWTETGLTWNNRPLFNGRANTYVSTPPAALTASGGGRIVVSATDAGNFVWLPIGTSTPAYYSKDRGVTWAASTGGPNSQIGGIYTNGGTASYTALPLASDRVNGNFYISRFAAWQSATNTTRHLTYKSTDGGQTWVANTGYINNSSFNLITPQFVAAPAANDLWFCDGGPQGAGLWRSTNGGDTWTKITTVGAASAVSFGKAYPGSGYAYAVYIYGKVGSVAGVYRSDNFGANWVKLADPTIEGSPVLAGDRQNAGNVFLGTGGRGIFRYNSGTASLTPVADAFVRDGASATTNAGNDPTLLVKLDGGGYTRWSYLKFDLSGVSGTVTSGKLRLTLTAPATSATPVALYSCSDTSWIEGNGGSDNNPTGELTWNVKPASSASALVTLTIPANAAAGTVYELDVTGYIQQQKTAGATAVTLVLKGTTSGSAYVVGFGSRETATAPELNLTLAP